MREPTEEMRKASRYYLGAGFNLAQVQRIHEHIDRANRIALVDPIVEAFRQQRRLLAIHHLNETLHHFPRRFSKGIIASTRFSHSLDPEQKSALARRRVDIAIEMSRGLGTREGAQAL